MDKKLPISAYLIIGLLLFSLFFGGGNLIFPAYLGQLSGTNMWIAVAGFLVTGVGLPLLAIIAIGISGVDNVQPLAARVHPIYGIVYTVILYLTIGPFFALPRTGTVSYEIGIAPFIGEDNHFIKLLIYTILFFGISLWLSLNPSRIVDRIGKILSPLMLLFIAVIIIMSFVNPLGSQSAPQESYESAAFVNGFLQGYNTLDALGGLAFGILIINSVKLYGQKSKKAIFTSVLKSGVIGVGLLALVYIFVAYIGSTSVTALGLADNGAPILSGASKHYMGTLGQVLLAFIIIIACLTTSVGLTSACAAYFYKLAPKFSYKTYAIVFTLFSACVANVGLSNLITFSTPVLLFLYPITIVLILLVLADSVFKGRRVVYVCTMVSTLLMSFVEGIHGFGISLGRIDQILSKYVPFYDLSMGWITFAIIGFSVGCILASVTSEKPDENTDISLAGETKFK